MEQTADPQHHRALILAVLKLETERLAAAAARWQDAATSDAAVATIDADLEQALHALRRAQIAYPGHALKEEHQLAGGEYLLLLLALMPFHAPDTLKAIQRTLTLEVGPPTLAAGFRLFSSGLSDSISLRERLQSRPLFSKGLVHASSDRNPVLTPDKRILALFGL